MGPISPMLSTDWGKKRSAVTAIRAAGSTHVAVTLEFHQQGMTLIVSHIILYLHANGVEEDPSR